VTMNLTREIAFMAPQKTPPKSRKPRATETGVRPKIRSTAIRGNEIRSKKNNASILIAAGDAAEQKAAHAMELSILRAFVERAPISIAMFDRRMRTVQVSQRWLDEFGLKRDLVIGSSHYENFPDLPEAWKVAHRRGLAGEELSGHEESFTAPDGNTHWLNWQITPWGDSGETTGGILIATDDVTARMLAEAAARKRELEYSALFENMTEGVTYCQMIFEHGKPCDFIYLSMNEAAAAMSGLRDVQGRKMSEVLPADKRPEPEILEFYGRVALTGVPEKREMYNHRLSQWFSLSAYSPEQGFFVVIFDIITERKNAELAARQWQQAFEQSESGIAIANVSTGTVQAANPAVARMLGCTVEELEGHPVSSFYPPDEWAHRTREVDKADSGAGHVLFETHVLRKDGTRFPALLDVTAIKDNSGTVVSRVKIIHDLTETKRAEQQAREAEQRSKSILNSLISHVALVGPDGAVLATNDAWNRFAMENGEASLQSVGPGSNYLTVCRRAAADGVEEARLALDCVERVLAGDPGPFQMEYACHSDTEQRWYLMNVSRLAGPAGGVVISHLNITNRKLAEITAQRAETTIRALVESTPQSVLAVSRDEIITLVNGHTQSMFGYTEEELLGRRLDLLIPREARLRHAEHQETYFANMQMRPMGLGLSLEAVRKDGTHFPCEIALSAVETPAGKQAVAFVSDITERRRLEHNAETHAKEVEALAASLMTAQEDERRRVSRELHDQICQQLASLAFDVGGLVSEPPPAAESRSQLKALQTRIVKASEEARHLAYTLHPSMLDDLGLEASLQALCREFSARAGNIALEFKGSAAPEAVSRETVSCLYRVAQESLQNIAKHAGAKRVSVALAARKRALVLTIADDGCGFNAESVKGQGGLGLIGMEERARLVHGKLTITSRAGIGTRIALQVPLPSGTA